MVRIIDRQEDALAERHIFEFRVYPSQASPNEVHGHAAPYWVIVGSQVLWLSTDFGEPVNVAFVAVLDLCKRHRIQTLWVNDPHLLFPPDKRPVQT